MIKKSNILGGQIRTENISFLPLNCFWSSCLQDVRFIRIFFLQPFFRAPSCKLLRISRDERAKTKNENFMRTGLKILKNSKL